MKTLILVTTLLLSALASAQSESAWLRKEMESFFLHWDLNLREGNAEAIMDVVAPDFTMVDSEGRRSTGSELRAMLERATHNGRRRLNSQTKVMHVREQANEAVAWVAVTSRLFGPKNPTRYFSHNLRRTASGWEIYYTQAMPTNNGWRPGGG